MEDNKYPNSNSAWGGGSPNTWNENAEIGVWDPATASNTSSNWQQPISSERYTSYSANMYANEQYSIPVTSGNAYNNNLQGSQSNWVEGDGSFGNNAEGSIPQNVPYIHPPSVYRQQQPDSQQNLWQDKNVPVQPYGNAMTADSQYGQWRSVDNVSRTVPRVYSPAEDWSTLNAQYGNTQTTSEFMPSYNSAKTFKNPFMDSTDDKSDDPVKLVQQLRIQEINAQKQINSRSTPRVISNSALALIRQHLEDAAIPFKSPELLKIARDTHLGLYESAEEISNKVMASNLSVTAKEFVPRKLPPVVEVSQATEEEEKQLLNDYQVFIEDILQQPGDFDERAELLLARMKMYRHSKGTVDEIVRILFDKAIAENNFKYLGAKLSSYFSEPNVLDGFRNTFLNSLQKQYKIIAELLKSEEAHKEDNRKKIHGFLMFKAEVFICIKINGTPIKALGRSLIKSLENLLSEALAPDICYVCNVLKLAGAPLQEAFEGSEVDESRFNKNIELLTQISKDYKKDSDDEKAKALCLIEKVINLKENNWGRATTPARTESVGAKNGKFSDFDQNYFMNEPVFYTTDGVPYTAAEANIPEFYDQHLSKSAVSHFHPSELEVDDLIASDDERELYKALDEDDKESEYENEYEKFLLESGQL